ncbi:Amiloride-sensitive sodium channel-like protein [Sarcoptes scabiei]|nr:Amiloride-sensitive sodium channel-like protein [Sarcoptes scabiei]
MALRDISQLVSEYYTYPITVDVRLRDSRRLQFPAVTVCNMNIVRYSALCVTNVSVIKDSMIPKDLRDRLCGYQSLSSTAPSKPESNSTGEATNSFPSNAFVTALPTETELDESNLISSKKTIKLTTVTPHTVSKHKKPTTHKFSAIGSPSSSSTLPSSSNDLNESIDDINSYGMLRNETDNNHLSNETISMKSNETATSSSESNQQTSTTVKTNLEKLNEELGMPLLDIQTESKELNRSKRKIMRMSTTVYPSSMFTLSTMDEASMNSTISSTIPPSISNEKDGLLRQQTTKNPGSTNSKANYFPKEIVSFADNAEIELTEREEKELQENLTNWLAVIYNSNEKIAKQLGHQFENFVLRCTIRSTNCTHANSFEKFFTPTEGNCFTFKSQNLRKSYLERIKDETSIAGVNYGLELVLNLEVSEYLTGTAQVGAIIMIAHPDEIGLSASEAIFVAPQQSTYIGMKMVNISRLPKPFPEECIDHWPPALVGRLTQNASYSQQACLKICLQRTIHTRCDCQSAQLPQLELNSTLKICDTRRKTTRQCVEEVMFQAEEKVNACKCPPRCQVINYEKTVSMTKWPTREDKVTFDGGKSMNINFQNLAKVTVYFQTMTCQEVRQEESYTTAKLFSSLGGILGMYVGFSFLSLFEIIEIFSRRFWFMVTKKKTNRFRTSVHAITATLAMRPKHNRFRSMKNLQKSSQNFGLNQDLSHWNNYVRQQTNLRRK